MYHINKHIYIYIMRNYPSRGFKGKSSYNGKYHHFLCDGAFLRVGDRNGRCLPSCWRGRVAPRCRGMSNDERDGTMNHQAVLTAASSRHTALAFSIESRVGRLSHGRKRWSCIFGYTNH